MQPFLTVTLGILVLFLGKALNSRLRVLQEFTIPNRSAADCLWRC